MGFFDIKKPISKPIVSQALSCDNCGLFRSCISPKMPWSGKGRLKTLFIAEGPGEEEDKQNTQLVGSSGNMLGEKLFALGYDLDIDFWKDNSLACRPPKNRTPTKKEISSCRPRLFKNISELRPKFIILMGGVAIEALYGERDAFRTPSGTPGYCQYIIRRLSFIIGMICTRAYLI